MKSLLTKKKNYLLQVHFSFLSVIKNFPSSKIAFQKWFTHSSIIYLPWYRHGNWFATTNSEQIPYKFVEKCVCVYFVVFVLWFTMSQHVLLVLLHHRALETKKGLRIKTEEEKSSSGWYNCLFQQNGMQRQRVQIVADNLFVI